MASMKTNLFALLGVCALSVLAGCDDTTGSGGAGGTGTTSSTKSSSGASMTTTGSTSGSTSAASGSTSSGTTTASSSTGGGMLTCADYCSTIMANCTGANAQWVDAGTCMTACASFAAGTLADTSGNTLGCRLYHAGAAAGAGAAVHCEHAGPLGGGQCGASECEGFCDIATDTCPNQWQTATCATQCALIANNEPFDTADTSGNSLACRMYHLEAAVTNAAVHCAHTTPVSSTCQ